MSVKHITVDVPDKPGWKAGEKVLLKANDLKLTLLPSDKDVEEPPLPVELDVTFNIPVGWPNPPGNRELVLAQVLPAPVNPGDPNKALETTTVTTTVISTLSRSKEGDGAPTGTTTSSGVPAATESLKPPPKDALSPGAAGGVGAVAGILFTVLVTSLCFLYFRKRRSTTFSRKPSTKPGYSDSPGHLFPTSGTSRATDDSAIYKALEVLPQPVARSNLQRDLGELRTGIGMCVDNYLHRDSIHLRDKDEQGFQALAGPRQDGRTWVSVLNDTRARPLATKALLAQCLLSMIRPKSDSSVLLLPPHLVATYKTLGKGTGGSIHRTRAETAQRAALITIWRQISGHLAPSRPPLEEAVTTVSSVVDPLRSQGKEHLDRVLNGLVKLTADLGMKLFVQPNEWQEDWGERLQHDSRAIVVFPGLFFVDTQQDLRSDGHSRKVSEPVVERF
jgi:hypothetical protein